MGRPTDGRSLVTGRRVAAIDCGTNSIRLLVADVRSDGTLADVVRTNEVVRLGYGVDRTGRIAPEAMDRTLAATRRYAAEAAALGATSVRFVATSASRDAENSAEFVDGVRAAFLDAYGQAVSPEVISGDEEAQLSFSGAASAVTPELAAPYLVVDLGGGSTEFVRGASAVEAAISTNVGSVRITERHLHSDPPTDAEIAAALVDIDAALEAADAAVSFTGIGTVVGLAGSITTITAHALDLPAYDRAAIDRTVLSAEAARTAALDLIHRTRAERAALPYLHPGRVDVIGAGALIWARIVERVSAQSPQVAFVISEHDILDGIALSISSR